MMAKRKNRSRGPRKFEVGGHTVVFRTYFPVGENYEFMDRLTDFWMKYSDYEGVPPLTDVIPLLPNVIESWDFTCKDGHIEVPEGEACEFPPTLENFNRLDMFQYGLPLASEAANYLGELAQANADIGADGKS